MSKVEINKLCFLLKNPGSYDELSRCKIINDAKILLTDNTNTFSLIIKPVTLEKAAYMSVFSMSAQPENSAIIEAFITTDQNLWEDFIDLLRISSGTFGVDIDIEDIKNSDYSAFKKSLAHERHTFIKTDVICLIREVSIGTTKDKFDPVSLNDVCESNQLEVQSCIDLIKAYDFEKIRALLQLWDKYEHSDVDHEIFEYCMGMGLNESYRIGEKNKTNEIGTLQLLLCADQNNAYMSKRSSGIMSIYRSRIDNSEVPLDHAAAFNLFAEVKADTHIPDQKESSQHVDKQRGILMDELHIQQHCPLYEACFVDTKFNTDMFYNYMNNFSQNHHMSLGCHSYPNDYKEIVRELAEIQDLNALQIMIENELISMRFIETCQFDVTSLKRIKLSSGLHNLFEKSVFNNEQKFLETFDKIKASPLYADDDDLLDDEDLSDVKDIQKN